MRQVQQDFVNAITLRYDDETRRNIIQIFSKKETLLDADLLEEHLIYQPMLGCIILFLLFVSLCALAFAIIFVSCRALGNCGAKRYQPHPTSTKHYSCLVAIFTVSWIAMSISAIFFIQSGIIMWHPKVPVDFAGIDHTVIKRNSSPQLDERLRLKRATIPPIESQKPMSVFDLFADEDYQGDFEVVVTSSTALPAFVTETSNDRPIPISRNRISSTNIKLPREEPKIDSKELDDIPPAVDRLPIRKITPIKSTTEASVTTATATITTPPLTVPIRPDNKIEIPGRPPAELDYPKISSSPSHSMQASFVGNMWNKTAIAKLSADFPRTRHSKLVIQTIPETTTVPNDITEDEEQNHEEETVFEAETASHEAISTPYPSSTTASSSPDGIKITTTTSASLETEVLSLEHQDDSGHEAEDDEGEEVDVADPKFPKFNARLKGSMEVVSREEKNETTTEVMTTTTPTTTTSIAFTPVEVTTETDNTTSNSITTAEEVIEEEEEEVTTVGEKLLLEKKMETEAIITTTKATTIPTTTESTTKMTTIKETTAESREHIEMVTIPVTEKTTTTEKIPLVIAKNIDIAPMEFVPIPKTKKVETWKSVTESPKVAATLATFPSVPLAPDHPSGKIEQLATPLLYPYRLLHTTAVVWMGRISLVVVASIMSIVTLPSLILILLGTMFYRSSQHPIDRRKTSDQIGQLVVILAIFLLFSLPLLLLFVQIALTYDHLHNAICPSLQLKYQQDLGIVGPINSLTPESRDVVLRNVINRDNCEDSEQPVRTLWISCLSFSFFSVFMIVSLFKLSKYYLRMKTEYYWTLNDTYGTIYGKRQAVDNNQIIYGNIYGTVGPRRPTSRPPPIPKSPAESSYADGPIYSDGPIYGVYTAYGRY